MVGEVFEVYELDEWGQAWVSKDWFRDDAGHGRGHSMGLDSHEMELVEAAEPPTS